MKRKSVKCVHVYRNAKMGKKGLNKVISKL